MKFKQGKDLQSLWASIGTYNEMIGNKPASELPLAGLMAACESQMGLIDDEFRELHLALQDWYREPTPENFLQVRKEFSDVLVTLAGFAYRAGITIEEDLSVVHQSNMSKFMSKEIADVTVEVYRQLEVQTYLDSIIHPETAEILYCVRSAVRQKDIYGKEYPAGKQLKPAGFKELPLQIPPL